MWPYLVELGPPFGGGTLLDLEAVRWISLQLSRDVVMLSNDIGK